MSEQPTVHNPDMNGDANINLLGAVLDFDTNQEVERRVIFTPQMTSLNDVANNAWQYQKFFGDGDFIAGGLLTIHPGGKKPEKSAKNNTYIFYIIEGRVNVKIHETNHVLSTGSSFMVPRGNTYEIENISDDTARFFFSQALKHA